MSLLEELRTVVHRRNDPMEVVLTACVTLLSENIARLPASEHDRLVATASRLLDTTVGLREVRWPSNA